MTAPPLAIAPHFHLARDWSQRLRDGDGCRSLSLEEIAPLLLAADAPREALTGCLCLFVIPSYLRAAFWQMLDEVGVEDTGFHGFAGEVARFLAFKHLPIPDGSVIDLVLSQPGQAADIDLRQTWGLVSLGEATASLVIDTLRIELDTGEGCRLPDAGVRGAVWPADEEPGVFVVVRLPV